MINQQISLQVLTLVQNGMNVIEALKQVCGEANVDQMISDLYDSLRAGK